MPKSRLESFSDCVMAFAITLLILDIHLADVAADISNAAMVHALIAMMPHFSIYVISFLSCTVWWISHHELINDLDHVDRRFLWLNSLFLMWIVVLPFTTGLLGHQPGQPIAIVLFGVVCGTTCVSFAFMRWYASYHGRLMKKDLTEVKLRRDLRISWSFPLLYLAATIGGFYIPAAGLVSYAAIPALFTVKRLLMDKEQRTSR